MVYQALGHLWVRDLPQRHAAPADDRRPTTSSSTRPGRATASQIVYTTWDDEKLGTDPRRRRPSGGEGRVVTSEPGHYVEPAFSPDGKQVVYRKIAGGFLRTRAWSREPGIYRVAGRRRARRRWSPSDGAPPQFGAESDRVFFLRFDGGDDKDERQLVSIGLDGTRRAHAPDAAPNATEFRVSPDEQWVAFGERFNAYVAPFVAHRQGGRRRAQGHGAAGARGSPRDAGEYLHWSGDAGALHWSLGPELFTRDLKDAFAFLAGAPEKLPDPPAQGHRPSASRPTSDVPQGTVALVGGARRHHEGATR